MYKTDSQKNSFLEQTKAAREERAFEKKKEVAITKIQSSIRGWLQRLKFRRDILAQVSEDLPDELKGPNVKPAVKIYVTINRFLIVWKRDEDRELFEKLCRYLVKSIESDSAKLSYISVALNKEYALNWIKQIKNILYKCCEYLEVLKPEVSIDMKSILLFLHTLVSFTSTNTWKILHAKSMEPLRPGMNQLCANIMGYLFMRGFYLTLNSLLVRGLSRQKVVLKQVSLTAIVTLAVRPLISASFSDKLLCMFTLCIMRVPALILHLNQLAPECISTLEKHDFLERTLDFLETERDGSVVFDSGSHAVCLVANLIHLAHLLRTTALLKINKLKFSEVLRRLMSKGLNSGKKDSKLSRWHPLLGWMSDCSSDASLLQESVNDIKSQLYLLWTQPLIHYFLVSTIMENSTRPPSPSPQPSNTHNFFKAVVTFEEPLQRYKHSFTPVKEILSQRPHYKMNCLNKNGRALDSRIGGKQPRYKIGTPDSPLTPVSKVFNMYYTYLTTLTPLRLDILTGLCYQDNMLYLMWKFLEGLGPMCGLKGFIDLLLSSLEPTYTIPEFNTLILFCECMTHYITLLDDIEMYEDQEPFKLHDYIALSSFLNMFLYKGVLNNLFEVKGGSGSSLYNVLHALLMTLYRRDSRRPYCPPNHWLIKDIKISAFLSDLEKGKKPTQLLLAKVPHVIPHTERVQLFRKFVANEKAVLGLTDSACASPHSTLITVHRKNELMRLFGNT